ncbi:SRPBCC family protein [Amycolatopsis magusensis]|uniref:SRPBCC family protein n=1 Tax=Amycolatopsis magusensis TaxID=882444 RepID=UPI003794FDA5
MRTNPKASARSACSGRRRSPATSGSSSWCPIRRFGYTLLRGFPLRDYRVDVELTPVGGGAEVHWHCEFTPKIPGTGWFFRWFLGSFHAKVVAGLGRGATV